MVRFRLSLLGVLLGLASLGFAASPAQKSASSELRAILSSELPRLGHRNWIVIADSAYPLQTAPGVETISVTDSQLDTVREVLAAIRRSKSVRPNVFLDAELPYVNEKFAPGIKAYRASLQKMIQGLPITRQLHEGIIKRLDAESATFHVLLIKTPHVLPYTSVFLRLECGYWSDQAEKDLRSRMGKKGK